MDATHPAMSAHDANVHDALTAYYEANGFAPTETYTAGANNDVIKGSTAGVATGETTFFQNGVQNITQKCSTGTVDAFDATVTFAGALTG